MNHRFRISWIFLTIVIIGGGTKQLIPNSLDSQFSLSTSDNILFLPLVVKNYHLLYESQNLFGHSVSAECNPAGGTICPCDQEDVDIQSYGDYGEVTSNFRQVHTWVNSIGTKKFTDVFPDSTPITLGTYKYTGEFRLPSQPAADINKIENPEAVHLMIQLWDGSNKLWDSNKTALEGTIYWALNPWTTDGIGGRIKIYTNPLNLLSTNVSINPDTQWHSFELIVNFKNQQYVSVVIDNQHVNPVNYELARVSHPEWGRDLSLIITTESLASWPNESCNYIFTWITQFRNLRLEKIE